MLCSIVRTTPNRSKILLLAVEGSFGAGGVTWGAEVESLRGNCKACNAEV